MERIKVSEHRCIKIRRRSLCDNCCVKNCTSFNGSRVTACEDFKPMFVVLMRCRQCGRVYDPYACISYLDYTLCPECNHVEKDEPPIVMACTP